MHCDWQDLSSWLHLRFGFQSLSRNLSELSNVRKIHAYLVQTLWNFINSVNPFRPLGPLPLKAKRDISPRPKLQEESVVLVCRDGPPQSSEKNR